MSRRKNTMMMGFMTHLPSSSPIRQPSQGSAFVGRGLAGVLDESKITSKGQMTLPKTVRAALGASTGDIVRFVAEDGKIVIELASEDSVEDPAVEAYLDILEGSIQTATDFPADLMNTIRALTAGIEVDLEAPIEGDVVI